jgi:hypothetical protein
MIALICFVLAVLASPFKSKSRLEAENAVLRHQLIVPQGRVCLINRLKSESENCCKFSFDFFRDVGVVGHEDSILCKVNKLQFQ